MSGCPEWNRLFPTHPIFTCPGRWNFRGPLSFLKPVHPIPRHRHTLARPWPGFSGLLSRLFWSVRVCAFAFVARAGPFFPHFPVLDIAQMHAVSTHGQANLWDERCRANGRNHLQTNKRCTREKGKTNQTKHIGPFCNRFGQTFRNMISNVCHFVNPAVWDQCCQEMCQCCHCSQISDVIPKPTLEY